MGDLKDPRLIWLKAVLFVILGVLSMALLLLLAPGWRITLLFVVAVWAFCRAYYFAFYVIEHYLDPGYKFAGLSSFVAYVLRQRNRKP